jgi:hypothetical protein
MTTNETPGPSGTQPDRYLEDISAGELSANALADETTPTRTADVNAIEGRTNGVNVSVRPYPYGISQRLSTGSKTGCTLP